MTVDSCVLFYMGTKLAMAQQAYFCYSTGVLTLNRFLSFAKWQLPGELRCRMCWQTKDRLSYLRWESDASPGGGTEGQRYALSFDSLMPFDCCLYGFFSLLDFHCF